MYKVGIKYKGKQISCGICLHDESDIFYINMYPVIFTFLKIPQLHFHLYLDKI